MSDESDVPIHISHYNDIESDSGTSVEIEAPRNDGIPFESESNDGITFESGSNDSTISERDSDEEDSETHDSEISGHSSNSGASMYVMGVNPRVNRNRDVTITRNPEEEDDDDEEAGDVVALSRTENRNDIQPIRDSNDDRSLSPAKKRARLDDPSDGEDDVNRTCVICYETYTSVGTHRAVCLKCGHIFGLSCLERWLINSTYPNRKCPSCNKKAALKDIRHLYFTSIAVKDNTENHNLKRKLAHLKQELFSTNIKLTKYKNKHMALSLKVNLLEVENSNLKELDFVSNEKVSSNKNEQYKLISTIALNKSSFGGIGNARSLLFDENKNILLATHNSNDNPMFRGFGYSLLKLNELDQLSLKKFHLITQLTIRDAAFHPLDSDVLLLVSLDKIARLIDVRTGSRIHSFDADRPLWSCAWDVQNPNIFIVGTVQGYLIKYDRRDTSYRKIIPTSGAGIGIVSIVSIKAGPGRGLPRGGFLICKLNSVFSLELEGEEEKFDLLDASGPFMSMSYLESKNQILLSSRPTRNFETIRHRIFSLDQTPNGKTILSLIQTIDGGVQAPVLSRSYIWPELINGHTIIYAYDDSQKAICGWSVSDSRMKYCIKSDVPILDICQVGPMLVALSDSAIHTYAIQN